MTKYPNMILVRDIAVAMVNSKEDFRTVGSLAIELDLSAETVAGALSWMDSNGWVRRPLGYKMAPDDYSSWYRLKARGYKFQEIKWAIRWALFRK